MIQVFEMVTLTYAILDRNHSQVRYVNRETKVAHCSVNRTKEVDPKTKKVNLKYHRQTENHHLKKNHLMPADIVMTEWSSMV